MRSFLLSISLIIASLILCACTPMMFGMPANQFNSLTPDQQRQVIDGYNQRKLIEKQNEPLNNLIGVADTALWREQALGH
jgi:hypothetical protein